MDDCPPDPAPPEGSLVRKLTLSNKKGLHARASARFVQTVQQFDAEVKVIRCGETVGGDSIMSLLTLAVPCGSTIQGFGPRQGRGIGARCARKAPRRTVR